MSEPAAASPKTLAETMQDLVFVNRRERTVHVILERWSAQTVDNEIFSWDLQQESDGASTTSARMSHPIGRIKKIRVLPFVINNNDGNLAVFHGRRIQMRIHELSECYSLADSRCKHQFSLKYQPTDRFGSSDGIKVSRSNTNMVWVGMYNLDIDNVQYSDRAAYLNLPYELEKYVIRFHGNEFVFQSGQTPTRFTVSFPMQIVYGVGVGIAMELQNLNTGAINVTVGVSYAAPNITFTFPSGTVPDGETIKQAIHSDGVIYVTGFTTSNPTADKAVIDYINRAKGILVRNVAGNARVLVRDAYFHSASDIPVSVALTGVVTATATATLANHLFNIPLEITYETNDEQER